VLLLRFALAFRRLRGQYATLVMIMLSVVVSGRYMYWRLTETTYWERPLDAAWGLLLVVSRGLFDDRADARLLPDRVAAQAQADAVAGKPRRMADRRRLHPDLQRAARRW
jgi:hypothetical protein